ncbi:MAG: flagellar export chaperone FliS [Selenomonadaceae bacterium]|nr:flagellar export chaperone FliS [Selenomonadaceae bacterium]
MVNAADAYKQQQLMNAPPEQLTLMLYNGCLRFIEDGIIAIKDKNFEDANTALQKAQRIITEFRVTLNMDYEISHQLLPLYNYVYDRLVEGNIRSKTEPVEEAREIMTELRDAWVGAMRKARIERGQGKGGQGYA